MYLPTRKITYSHNVYQVSETLHPHLGFKVRNPASVANSRPASQSKTTGRTEKMGLRKIQSTDQMSAGDWKLKELNERILEKLGKRMGKEFKKEQDAHRLTDRVQPLFIYKKNEEGDYSKAEDKRRSLSKSGVADLSQKHETVESRVKNLFGVTILKKENSMKIKPTPPLNPTMRFTRKAGNATYKNPQEKPEKKLSETHYQESDNFVVRNEPKAVLKDQMMKMAQLMKGKNPKKPSYLSVD